MSNHETQERLFKEFLNSAVGIFYERKRGEFKAYMEALPSNKQKDLKRKYVRVPNDKMAQAYWAYVGRPASAKSEKGMLFINKDQKGYFDDIFTSDRTIEELVLPYRILKHVSEKRKDASAELGKREENLERLSSEEKKVLAMDNFIKHSDFFVVAGIGYMCSKHYSSYDAIEYDKLLPIFDKWIDRMYGKVVLELEYLIKEEYEKPGFSFNNFFKDESSFSKLKQKIDYRTKLAGIEGESPYIQFPELS
jgi:AIPR protein